MGISREAKQALVAAVIINLAAGAQYCWSILGRQVISEYGWTATEAALPFTVLMVVAGVWAIVAGKIGDYLKPKYGTILGGICMGLGLIISGQTSSPVIMLLSAGVLLGIASTSITSNTSPTAVKWWPMRYKGMISGIATSGMAFSSLYMAPVISLLLVAVGIKWTFVWTGVGAMTVIIIMSLFLPTPPKAQPGGGAGPLAEQDSSIYKNTVTPEQALKKYELWVLFGVLGCATMSGIMLTSQIANIAVAQASWEKSYILVMMLAIGNGVGRLVLPAVSDRIGCFNCWKILSALTFANMMAFTYYTSPALMIFGTLFLGLFYGACIPLSWASIAAVFGKRYMGSIFGYVAVSVSLAAIIGPMTAAKAYDLTGSYSIGYWAIAGFQVIGFALACTIKDKPVPKTIAEDKALQNAEA